MSVLDGAERVPLIQRTADNRYLLTLDSVERSAENGLSWREAVGEQFDVTDAVCRVMFSAAGDMWNYAEEALGHLERPEIAAANEASEAVADGYDMMAYTAYMLRTAIDEFEERARIGYAKVAQ